MFVKPESFAPSSLRAVMQPLMTLPFCMMTSSCSCRQRLSFPTEDEGKGDLAQIDQSGISLR